MKKKNRIDLLKILADFQTTLDNKPPLAQMFDEVRMMRFKIKPLQGDISVLNFSDTKLIEILWNLGKLDEFFRRQHKKLTANEEELFFQYFDDLYEKFQTQLNKVNLRSEKEGFPPSAVEMEIFKEESRKKKLN